MATEARIVGGDDAIGLDEMAGTTVHAVAGIGHPERFFTMLESHGIAVVRHPLPDHASIDGDTLRFDDDLPVVMTEKDAVKCATPSDNLWFVPAAVDMEAVDWLDRIESVLKRAGR